MSAEFDSRLRLACEAVREAGQLTLRYFQRDDLRIDLKHDATPVTVADCEAEQLLRFRIAAMFPQDGILGEEFGEESGTSGFRWILDPIDGTKSFIHGVPLYSVLIGMEHEAESKIGVIHLPALDHTVYACRGQGAWQVRGQQIRKPARVSQTKTLADSLFLTSGLTGFHRRGAWPFFEKLSQTAKLMRTWGDAYGYFLVAIGQADVMVDPVMNVWDAAAILPVIHEAGGTFTDWQGASTIHHGEGIATNGLVLNELLRLLQAST